MAPHLFAHWTEIAAKIRGARTIALFLDFDGTLADLNPHPEAVRIGASMRFAIRSLGRDPRVRVCVISGRRRADVRERIGIPAIRYLGLYGWEGPHGAMGGVCASAEIRPILECLKLRLQMSEDLRFTWVEDKGTTITIHHFADATPARRDCMGEAILREIERFGKRFRVMPGARSWEIASKDWKDKGAAVRRELASIERGALPIYLGDEPADEPAFAALPDGITVRVGEPAPSAARYRLVSVAQVRVCLERIQKEVM